MIAAQMKRAHHRLLHSSPPANMGALPQRDRLRRTPREPLPHEECCKLKEDDKHQPISVQQWSAWGKGPNQVSSRLSGPTGGRDRRDVPWRVVFVGPFRL
ncbi:hypothetical protein CDAR_460241 [Caerostris darwini]|uniref:Uncharacterized protein n=1 Tax=Caerostris darwini TaxID=1538125 RepID=A0AAV4R7F4_9ARAC|nr:hypothetical protein CDAR_460241 [Caerostris darwini]